MRNGGFYRDFKVRMRFEKSRRASNTPAWEKEVIMERLSDDVILL